MTRHTDAATAWGLPHHHVATTRRSARGQLADGSLVYGYVRDATAPELAAAVLPTGAETATAPDGNTGGPAALVVRPAGGHLLSARLSPVMHQYLDACYSRTEKGLIAVDARP